MIRDNSESVILFLLDGTPTGRIKCSIDGTLTVVFKINKDDLELCKDREELKQAGIYFLFGGTSDKSVKDVVYIGQARVRSNGEGLLYRLQEHKRNPEKDYWNEAIAITVKDNSLGETELCYLENYFCTLAQQTNRYIVKNNNTPNCGNISEEKKRALNKIINQIELIMGCLNYKVFVPLKEDNGNKFFLNRFNRKAGVTASAMGQPTRDGFVVLKGSYIVSEEMKAIPEKVRQMRSVANINKDRILQEDVLFSSPSYAAAFVIGGSANGLTEWKTKEGIPLKQFES